MIDCKVNDLPAEKKAWFASKVLEYWNPNTGINENGLALLSENKLALTSNSSKEDIKKYIINETKKNSAIVINAFKTNTSQMLIESMKEDIQEKTGKSLKESVVRDIIWNIIAEKIKIGG